MHKSTSVIPTLATLPTRWRSLILGSALALTCASPATVLALPGLPATGAATSIAQNVDYIGPEAGAALDLDFPVLVPSWVPGPFGGSPSIDSGGGYYSLYWMNAGGEPTFLQVTGQVGGALPAGSPYDLNVQLFINAQVQGYGAIHDVTPAYDTVWWIAGGVLYKVESRNSATDSLTLANSLITFVPPSAPAPQPEPEPTSPPVVQEPAPVTPVPSTTAPGESSGGSTTLPDVDTGTTGPETAVTPGESGGSGQGTGGATGDESPPEPAGQDQGAEEQGESESESETPQVTPIPTDGTGDTGFSSDGTGGAQNLVLGGDGTGGTVDIVIPRRPAGQPAP